MTKKKFAVTAKIGKANDIKFSFSLKAVPIPKEQAELLLAIRRLSFPNTKLKPEDICRFEIVDEVGDSS